MGDKMETGDSSFSYDMPMELLTEILIHLPVKSLIRFTVVCKSWLHLIRNNPQFALRHYLTKTRPLPTTLMDNADYIVEYFGNYGRRCNCTMEEEVLSLYMHSLTEKKTFCLFKRLEFGPGLNVSVSNLCHGLLCVYVSSSFGGARVFLCNPAIREVVPLPLPHNPSRNTLPILGIGFDPISNNYKVMAAYPTCVFGGRSSWEVNLYSVRDGSWRDLPSTGSSLDRFSSLILDPAVNAHGRVINWVGYLKSSKPAQGVLSFDMVDEVFREVSIPECVCPRTRHLHHLLPYVGCKACLRCSLFPGLVQGENGRSNEISIWALNRDEELWKKQISLTFPDDFVVCSTNLWMNDNELLLHVVKEGTIGGEVYHYDIFARQLKRTGRVGVLLNPDGYTESLISIKELMSPPPSLYLQAMRDEREKEEDEVRFIREVGRKNTDVHWSYAFTLVG